LLRVFKNREETLLIVGSGPKKDEYLNFIKENKMDNVIIKDFMKKEELMNLFTGCDFFITLSLEDIYGHTTNEAMAKGLPVISSNKVVSSLPLIENGIVDTREIELKRVAPLVDFCRGLLCGLKIKE
jgi:glycosyltransferase involved in cell wall biosynthesis